jgi:hypothetical protein
VFKKLILKYAKENINLFIKELKNPFKKENRNLKIQKKKFKFFTITSKLLL